jgi:putative ATPase
MPEDLKGSKLYDPGNNTRENSQREFLKELWKDKYEY